jgi:hypothetical protein
MLALALAYAIFFGKDFCKPNYTYMDYKIEKLEEESLEDSLISEKSKESQLSTEKERKTEEEKE